MAKVAQMRRPPTKSDGKSAESVRMSRLGEATRAQAFVGVFLLFLALGITSAPLFEPAVDAEHLSNSDDMIVRKNTSYAKAYLMGAGFFDALSEKVNSTDPVMTWYPQPDDTTFIGFPHLDLSAYPAGVCSILDTSTQGGPECLLMTGHDGRVAPYGLCRNGSEFLSIHVVMMIATPMDVGTLVSTGAWNEGYREIAFIGLASEPTCAAGTKLQIKVDLSDIREISGDFQRVTGEPVNPWFDIMGLPPSVLTRQFYVEGKQSSREGVTLPLKKLQSYDGIISQKGFVSTISDKLEIVAPYSDSPYAYVTNFRDSGADVTLPRLQFTFAVAAQALGLLIFFLIVAAKNSVLDTYHCMHQVLRLPTFFVISLQLIYVLYYQIFTISYLANVMSVPKIYILKVTYSGALSYIILHQLDVRSAVSLWPKMANNDSYYFVRIVWMLASLAVFVWSLMVKNPDHYVLSNSSTCPLGAGECNEPVMMLFQHYVCMGVLLAHPIAYGIIQVTQWRRNQLEYRHPVRNTGAKAETTFETLACGGVLADYYYYNTLVFSSSSNPSTVKAIKEDEKAEYKTCSKAVRDEGFVMIGGGCSAIIRAKDLYVVMLMRVLPSRVASTINLSITVIYIEDDKVSGMRRLTYNALWAFSQQWNGRISYPDIG